MAIGFVLALLVLTLANFAWEWIRIEVFSLLVIAALVIAGILTPFEAFASLSSSTVVMIAGIMLLTGALVHNGAASWVATGIDRLAGRSERKTAAYLLSAVNVVSSIVNNVAATAMFIPVAEGLARRFRVPRGRYLMPVAFASMTGGMCTLIGTSTNVAVSTALPHYGLRPLGLFELSPVGVAIAVCGVGYLLWAAPRLLPTTDPDDDALDAYGVREFLYEVFVLPGAAAAGKTLGEADLGRRFGIDVLAIVRGTDRIDAPTSHETLHVGDLLLVEGEPRTIPAIAGVRGFKIKSMAEPSRDGLVAGELKTVEATVSWNSPLVGKSLRDFDFRRRFELSVLAVHRRGETLVEKVGKIELKAGDVLLVFGREEAFGRLATAPVFLLVEDLPLPNIDLRQAAIAGAILFTAVAASASGFLDAPSAFFAGGVLAVATGCLPFRRMGDHVAFPFLLMLAAMTALGMAMDSSGAAALVAGKVVGSLHPAGPIPFLALFFLLTVALTQPLNNAAAALLVLPIAVHAAEALGISARPFAIAVALGASCSFITPFEPACLLVYGTGRYRFRDFVIVGGGLTAVAFALSLVLIPRLWPLTQVP